MNPEEYSYQPTKTAVVGFMSNREELWVPVDVIARKVPMMERAVPRLKLEGVVEERADNRRRYLALKSKTNIHP